MKKTRHTLLLVDDERANLQKLRRTFQDTYSILEAASGEEALETLKRRTVSAIITDQRMPGISGAELLRLSLEVQPDLVRIILTGYTEVEDLMDAINQGHVHSYITKPWEPVSLRRTVEQQLRQWELEKENERLTEELSQANRKLERENVQLRHEVRLLKDDTSQFIYQSRSMSELLSMLDRVVQTDSTVLIQGETGTGKELLARYIHEHSGRAAQAFVPVNCGAIPRDLVESAFFGHRKGAFTGATEDQKGYFEVADQGTLFLDEVGEAPLALQVKLLRVLQDGQIYRVGGMRPRHVDVRVVASTNRRLDQMVEEGGFRQDLFFRLNVFSVLVPPLRARTDDIEPLAQYFLKRFERRLNKTSGGYEAETLERVQKYPWPGNVRELENEVERLVILCDPGQQITPDLLSERIRHCGREASSLGPLKDQVTALERRLILEALHRHKQNKSQAADSLGITRQTIIAKLKQYGRGPSPD